MYYEQRGTIGILIRGFEQKSKCLGIELNIDLNKKGVNFLLFLIYII